MLKIGFTVILFLFLIGTVSCSPVSETQQAIIETEPKILIAKSDTIAEIKYFHGGWYGLPTAPNWSHDMTFTFNENGTVGIDAKIPEDELCGKAGSLSVAEKNELLTLVNNMKLGSMQFGMIDGGVHMLTIKTKSGDITNIYLPNSDFVGEDQLYAIEGGEAVRDKLAEIFDGLAMYCQ